MSFARGKHLLPVLPNADTIPYLSTRWCASAKPLQIECAQVPNSLMTTTDLVLHPTLWAAGLVTLAESQRPAVLNLAHVCTLVTTLPSTPHYMPRTQLGLRPRTPDVCAVMARPGSSHGPHGTTPQSFACGHLFRHATTSPQPGVLLQCVPIHVETGNFVNR